MKKSILWVGLLFLSVSWLFLIPVFEEPDYLIGFIFLIIGLVLNIVAFWGEKIEIINKKYFFVLIPFLFFIIIVPFPFNIGIVILFFASLFYFLKNFMLNKKNYNWIFLGFSISGIILSIQMLFFPLYVIFVSHFPQAKSLSPIVSSIANFLGLKTSSLNGVLYIQTMNTTFSITTTLERLGFFLWFFLFVGSLFLFFFIKNKRKICIYIIIFIIFSGIYLLLRYVFILHYFTLSESILVFWDLFLIFFSFVPFSLILMKFLPLDGLDYNINSLRKFKFSKKILISLFFIFLFIFSIVGAFVFQDPGIEKNGRILIDEYHSSWENTTEVMDKEWYGHISTYNYYNWAEWLDKYYTVVKNRNNTLNSKILNNYDILILKCPTNKYSDEEVRDIVNFVKNGGGLYLIGDHTNVFGMNIFLNQVSQVFGITFNIDSTYDLTDGGFSKFKTSLIFPHPIVQNMEEFQFRTSCTIKAPINSENVIIGNRLLSQPGTYSTQNFFRKDEMGEMDIEFGYLLQVAAVKHEKGRVLAFTDSTCFSNFCFFWGGYKDFNLGVIEYLNRENSLSFLNNFFVLLSGISLFISLYLLKKKHKIHIVYLFLFGSVLAFSVAIPIFSYINDINYKLPDAKEDFFTVCFEQEHSDVLIEKLIGMESILPEKSFGTFFVWTQRVGCYPSIEKTLEESIKNGDTVVIINPVKSFDNKELQLIENYLKNGGKLLVMDSIINSKSTANELLDIFNLKIYQNSTQFSINKPFLYTGSNSSNDSNINIGDIVIPYLFIEGGDEIYLLEEYNNSFISVKTIGKGKIVVMVDSYTFSNEIMQGPFTIPDDDLRKIYDIEYYIFEELLNCDKK